jgi:hypothetical protein
MFRREQFWLRLRFPPQELTAALQWSLAIWTPWYQIVSDQMISY